STAATGSRAAAPWWSIRTDISRFSRGCGMRSVSSAGRSSRRRRPRNMRILVATDAWHPQLSGVARTLRSLAESLHKLGVEAQFLTPEGMRTVALPGFPDARIALPDPRAIAARIAAIAPDAIHIATDGPIGLAVRRYCRRRGRAFTTSLHTRCAGSVAARWPLPDGLRWAWRRWFHNAGRGTMAATAS